MLSKVFQVKLREARKKKGYTQEELATLLGLKAQAVFKYESGIVFPPYDKFEKLLEIFECKPSDLLEEKDIVSEFQEKADVYKSRIIAQLYTHYHSDEEEYIKIIYDEFGRQVDIESYSGEQAIEQIMISMFDFTSWSFEELEDFVNNHYLKSFLERSKRFEEG